ncbi:MAG: HAMP domain-containing protein [Deltaproteobacteria bacterium]|nr:HAMP domain-containing protein [Deltaproteobacteria bacterium]MBW2534434.1 HAMP domain-containing protein [Deltaproteobacteria bacterium]
MTRKVGRTERRVVLAILVTAIVPLATAMGLAEVYIQRLSQTAFQPEFSEHLDRALGVYADLVKSMKSSMRHEATAMAASQPLRAAAAGAGDTVPGGSAALATELDALLRDRPHVLSAVIEGPEGEPLAERRRAKPIDEAKERPFTVVRPMGDADGGLQLTVEFAADRTRLDEMESAQSFAQAYQLLSNKHRSQWIDQTYVRVFAVLFGLTVLLAVIIGIRVVRPVTRRINRMAAATRPVAEGDLSVRVEASGADEIADLARAFNHMLEALERSRARIEFLNRIAEWQHMARRLAHEIKNPLTPIQLAVEECHRRYDGDDERYAQLLRTTVDIVVEEVGSLRRLVREFAEFARLPRAQLEQGDLADYLREQKERLVLGELPEGADGKPAPVELTMDVVGGSLPVAFDGEMLYRVLANLVSNAVQAIQGDETVGAESAEPRRVRLSARRRGEHCELDVDDDGPGIKPELRPRVFEPYRTTKQDGTGLGLTIVKKIVIDHGGHVDVDESPLGGARFSVRLPLLGTSESEAALAQSEAAPLSGQ